MEKEYLIQIQLQTASDLLHKEDVQSALILLEHLLDDHPNCFEALLMAGQCYLLLGSSLAAQEALHLCAQVLPQNEELLYALCIAHFEACCFESAMETARQILTLAPKSDLAWSSKSCSAEGFFSVIRVSFYLERCFAPPLRMMFK